MTNEEKIKLANAIKVVKREKAKKDYYTFSEQYLYITDKKANKIKLVQNNVQRQLNAKMEELKQQCKPPRIIILKSRQMGISTDVGGRMVFETTTKENKNGLVVAHRDDSTSALFEKDKFYYDNLTEDVKPVKKASNAKELVFDTPNNYTGNKKGLHSKIKIQTAGNAGIGRSDTFHYVHLSEYAFWSGSDANAPDKQLTGILQSVPDELDTWVIIESTANGMNEFKSEWDKAVAGNSAFTPIFLAWHDHEEYIKEVNDIEYFKSTFSEYEHWLYNDLNLPIERVAWWRWALKNKCNNDINQMKQENPTTPEEAFIFSGTPVFDNDKIIKHINRLEEKYKEEPYKEGYFEFEWSDYDWKDRIIDNTIRFVESKQKPYIRIYEDRKKGFPYVLSGDTKGEGKDEYTGQVMDNTNKFRVATLQMQLNNSKYYTWQMYCLGLYYNTALIGIEMNFNTAPLEELVRLRYSKMYYREKPDEYYGKTNGKIGFKTDMVTRPRMIDKEIYLANEKLYLIRDIPTLQQMLTFVYDKNGRPDAMPGKHDDLLISDCILDEISDQQTTMASNEHKNKTIREHFFNEHTNQSNSIAEQSFLDYGNGW